MLKGLGFRDDYVGIDNMFKKRKQKCWILFESLLSCGWYWAPNYTSQIYMVSCTTTRYASSFQYVGGRHTPWAVVARRLVFVSILYNQDLGEQCTELRLAKIPIGASLPSPVGPWQRKPWQGFRRRWGWRDLGVAAGLHLQTRV